MKKNLEKKEKIILGKIYKKSETKIITNFNLFKEIS